MMLIANFLGWLVVGSMFIIGGTNGQTRFMGMLFLAFAVANGVAYFVG